MKALGWLLTALLVGVLLTGCVRWVPRQLDLTEAQQQEDARACTEESWIPDAAVPGLVGFLVTLSAEINTARLMKECMAERGYSKTINGRVIP